jgi:hypothetical protein
MNHVAFERKIISNTRKVGFTKKVGFTPSWVLGSNTRVGFKGRWASLQVGFWDQTQEWVSKEGGFHLKGCVFGGSNTRAPTCASTLHEGWTFVA